jgi:hypothetical protein
MKLDKFTSGRFHQLRDQKSYLAANQSRYNNRLSTRSPRCYTNVEDLRHVVLQCPSHFFAREEFISELLSTDDIWDTPTTINQFSLYLRATLTG